MITLQVSDEVGALCTDQILLQLGTPPTAIIDTPSNGAIFTAGDRMSFQGAVSDQEEALSDLVTTWSSSIDGELQTGGANSQGISQFASANLSAGIHSLSFSAIDPLGLETNDVISIQINSPPAVDSVILSPNPLYSYDTLTVSTSVSDADGDPITEAYAWYEDGTLTSFTGTTIPASN